MKGTVIDFLKLTIEQPKLADELVELAAKYDFEFTEEELSEAELDQVAGGTTTDAIQLAMDRRAKFIQTLSNIVKKQESAEDSIIQNIK